MAAPVRRILAILGILLALPLGGCGQAQPLSALPNIPPGFGGNNSNNGGA